MHNLKKLRDELIDEAESYVGAINAHHDGKDAECIKCLLSAADHADAILERHGMAEDDEEQRSGRRMGRRYYGMDDGMDNSRVERGRADATSGTDKRAIRELKRIAEDVENPTLKSAIMQATRMAEI